MKKNIVRTIVAILGISMSTIFMPEVTALAAPEAYLSTGYYTVRESWSNPSSSLGSFRRYENAVNLASENPGFEVYDPSGTQVYPEIAGSSDNNNADIMYTTDYLNLRSGASTGYSVILTMPVGSKVTVIEKSSDGKWTKVNYGSSTGWCSSDYLKGSTSTPIPDPTPAIEEVIKFTSDYLNLRSGAATSYSILLTMPKGAKVTVIDTSADGKWSKVKYGSSTGWANNLYLTDGNSAPAPTTPAEPPVTTVPTPEPIPEPTPEPQAAPEVTKYTTDYLNLRSGAGTSFSILTTIPTRTKVTVTDSQSGWDKVSYASYVGWSSAAYLSTTAPAAPTAPTAPTTPSTPSTPVTDESSPIGEQAAAAAMSALGAPYVYGGESWAEGGFDCSGLTQWAYKQVGISIPRTATTQYNGLKKVSSPIVGDLVVYASGGSIQHVGMYIGNGQIVHSPDVGKFVEVRSVNFNTMSIYGYVRPY